MAGERGGEGARDRREMSRGGGSGEKQGRVEIVEGRVVKGKKEE